jgi:hypothetical protein
MKSSTSSTITPKTSSRRSPKAWKPPNHSVTG